jgi:hypothetical protein
MNTVINQNNLVRKSNFSSVIKEQDNILACDIVRKIILEDGNYFINSPKFQTRENIFSRPGIVQRDQYRFILAVDVEYQ